MDSPYLVGERIYTRSLTVKDFQSKAYLGWINDSSVRQHIGGGYFPTTSEDIESFCRRKLNSTRDSFMAIVDKSDNCHIGNAGIINISWTDRVGEISTLIGNKEYWGAGYFAEVVGMLAYYSFYELNLNKIWSGASNPAIFTTLTQSGWRNEGIFKDHRFIDGRYHDVVVMAIFRDEFKVRFGDK